MFDMFYVSWRRRNIYILFSSKSDRFPYVSNKNKAVSKVIISRTHIYMFHLFYMFHDGGLTFICYYLLSLIVFLMFQTKIRVSRVIISGTHTYMFHMFYMFHDRGVTFIFYSLLSLIVFLMFQTKINPFQEWLFYERIFICSMCYICFMTEA